MFFYCIKPSYITIITNKKGFELNMSNPSVIINYLTFISHCTFSMEHI